MAMALKSYLETINPKKTKKLIVGSLIGVFVLRCIAKSIPAYLSKRKVLSKAAQRRDQLMKKIAESKKLIPHFEITEEKRKEILEADATKLLQMLAQNATTSEEILVVYYQQALAMNEKFNFLTDVNFEEALRIARECDQLRQSDPTAKDKILFGIPVSVKDCVRQKGFDNTCGIVNKINIIHEKDAIGLKQLLDHGAIPFVRTNVPQAMMTWTSENIIFGETTNPWDSTRTPGGSSGGEAAIVASLGSPLGVGTDIGGSIRIPSSFCGLYGFKPTAGRISGQGTGHGALSGMGQINVRSTIGPLAKSVDDINLFMRCAAASYLDDPYSARIPWNDESTRLDEGKRLRIGYYKTLKFVTASAAAQRAVQEVVDKLASLGHEMIEIEVPDINEINLSNLQILFGEGGLRTLRSASKGEDLHSAYKLMAGVQSLSGLSRTVISWILLKLGEKQAASVMKNVKELTTHEYLLNIKRQKKLQDQYMTLWAENKLDCVICPSFAIPAVKSQAFQKLGAVALYTTLYNYMNMPAGVLPITTVKEGEDIYDFKVEEKQQLIEKATKEAMKGSVGLPMGVQVVGLPFEDEKCVSVMRLIEKEFPFRRNYPISLP